MEYCGAGSVADIMKLRNKVVSNSCNSCQHIYPKFSGLSCSKVYKVVSECEFKISILKYGKYIDFFFFWLKKM